MPSLGTVKSLSTISWHRLRSLLMALGSTMMRIKGALIGVLVSGHNVMLGWATSQRFVCTPTAGLGLLGDDPGLATVMT